jgi:hypothetical protein
MQCIGPADSVWIPPAVKHCHGATPTSGMEHPATSGSLNGKPFEWLEKVSDRQYVSSLAEKAPDAPVGDLRPVSQCIRPVHGNSRTTLA